MGFPSDSEVKNPPAMKEMRVRSLGQEDPLEQPTPIFFSGESLGKRSLVGYSSQGHKECNVTEVSQQTHTQRNCEIL